MANCMKTKGGMAKGKPANKAPEPSKKKSPSKPKKSMGDKW